ncbi:methyl-accepting chemotaxis protein [Alkalibacterium iburiense]|uniref:Methyl-accepting chemotaxis protein n=1 Tax=Alkalibacterium iburiense TaxID=290589 RepID=A0ABP3HDR0_9LACT
MKITTKLLTSYLVLALIIFILGILALFGLGTMDENSEEIFTERLQPTVYLAEIAQLMGNTRVHLLTGVINADPSRGEPALENIGRVNEILSLYQERTLHNDEAELFDELVRNWENYSDMIVETEEYLAEEDYTEAMNGIRSGEAWYGAANMHLTNLKDIKEELSRTAYNESNLIYSNLRRLIILASVVAIIFSIFIALLVGRIIGKPINVISQKLSQISKGNLTGESIQTKRKDEIGLLEQATNQLQTDLRRIISSVSQATGQVMSSSEELTQSTHEVSQGADQIAITMQELASGSESQAMFTSDLSESMTAFVQTIEESVDESERVSHSASEVRQLTDNGQGMMNDSVRQMQTIDQLVKESVDSVRGLDSKSAEVSSLVTVIEQVAEQTNLLALNAAIEASRAGEHGRGFAVVAEEVRKLSEEVAGSVGEITAIVKSMQEETSQVVKALEEGYGEVTKGTTQIQQTGETFTSISESVEQMERTVQWIVEKLADNKEQTIKMSTSVEEIASISEESAAGIEQTSATSEQATSTMQEVSANSEELARLAEELYNLISRFEL